MMTYFICKVVWKPLATELARRGHRITFMGPKADKDMANNDNITYVYTNIDLDKDFNSTSIFEGHYFTNFTFFRSALRVSNVRDIGFNNIPKQL